jgi:hypothetical protein
MGFCANGARQVSKNEPPPRWLQLLGVFCQGKHFHPHTFLEAVEQVHE